jgi:polar amino acid transport system substrate-binding protein
MRTLCPLALAFLLLVGPARADCSRPIQVPVAEIGLSVIVHGQEVSGIYRDILDDVSKHLNCQFLYKPVPRARLEAMFQAGTADLLLPAPRTEQRDRHGVFVPLIQARAAVISMEGKLPRVLSLADLKKLPLRVAVVRGFDYGKDYERFLADMQGTERLFVEVNPVAVARLLQAGIADVTIMTPTVLAGAILGDSRVSGMIERLHIDPVDELGWVESGVYVSKTSLSEADRRALLGALSAPSLSKVIWDSYKRHYPPAILAGSLRPR